MKTPCTIRNWKGQELAKGTLSISPPLPAQGGRLWTWTGHFFIAQDRPDWSDCALALVTDEPLTIVVGEGHRGPFRATRCNPKTGEVEMESLGPLERV
jgi:hypothetical protein